MKARAIAVGLAVGLVSAMGVLTLSHSSAQARPAVVASAAIGSVVSPVVNRIATLDTKDPIRARKEMLALYRQNGLHSGADYRAAAKVLEGSKDRNDLLMAHDLAVAGLALGDGEAKLIVARTEDILFKSVGLGERFGTQKGSNLPLTAEHRKLMTSNRPIVTLGNGSMPVPVPVASAV